MFVRNNYFNSIGVITAWMSFGVKGNSKEFITHYKIVMENSIYGPELTGQGKTLKNIKIRMTISNYNVY